MAQYSFVKHPLLSSLVLALFLCFVVSFSSARIVQVSDICSKHYTPSNCLNILNSIPGVAAGADLDSLSLYIINLAHVNAFDTITLVHTLIGNTTDSQLKQRYAACSMDYDDALLCLTQAKISYGSQDFSAMKSNSASVLKDVQDCGSKVPSDSSPLLKNNQDLEDVSVIIMVLADFLAGIY